MTEDVATAGARYPHLHTLPCSVHFDPQKLQGALVLQDNPAQATPPR
jgi:hypothetical protein